MIYYSDILRKLEAQKKGGKVTPPLAASQPTLELKPASSQTDQEIAKIFGGESQEAETIQVAKPEFNIEDHRVTDEQIDEHYADASIDVTKPIPQVKASATETVVTEPVAAPEVNESRPATEAEIDDIFGTTDDTEVTTQAQAVESEMKPEEKRAATDEEIDSIFSDDSSDEASTSIEADTVTTQTDSAPAADESRPATDEEIDSIFGDTPVDEAPAAPAVNESRPATDAEIDDIFGDTAPEPTESPEPEVNESRPASDSEIDAIFGADVSETSPEEEVSIFDEARPATEAEIDDIFSDAPAESASDQMDESRPATDAEIDSIFGDVPDPEPENTGQAPINEAEIDDIFSDSPKLETSIEKNSSKEATSDSNNVILSDPSEGAESAASVDPGTSAVASDEEIDALFGGKTNEPADAREAFLQDLDEDFDDPKKKRS